MDGFLSKFTPDGSTLIFSTYYGGSLENEFNAVALDSADNIYVAGKAFGPTDLIGTVTAIQQHATATANMQLVRFDPTGKLLYSTYLGGKSGQSATSVAVEKPGVAWIGGATASADMPTTSNGFLTKYTGLIKVAYFARIDTTKSGMAGLTYASFFNGTAGNSTISKLFFDPRGQVVFCGSAFSDLPTTPTAMQASEPGAQQSEVSNSLVNGDGFIARINPALAGSSALTYGSFIGGVDLDSVAGCGLDSKGNFVVAGSTLSGDPFLTVGSPLPIKAIGTSNNIFVIRIDPAQAGGRWRACCSGARTPTCPKPWRLTPRDSPIWPAIHFPRSYRLLGTHFKRKMAAIITRWRMRPVVATVGSCSSISTPPKSASPRWRRIAATSSLAPRVRCFRMRWQCTWPIPTETGWPCPATQ